MYDGFTEVQIVSCSTNTVWGVLFFIVIISYNYIIIIVTK